MSRGVRSILVCMHVIMERDYSTVALFFSPALILLQNAPAKWNGVNNFRTRAMQYIRIL